jgi:hypothetical protein
MVVFSQLKKNSGSGGYRGGQLAEAAWNRLRTGGTK